MIPDDVYGMTDTKVTAASTQNIPDPDHPLDASHLSHVCSAGG